MLRSHSLHHHTWFKKGFYNQTALQEHDMLELDNTAAGPEEQKFRAGSMRCSQRGTVCVAADVATGAVRAVRAHPLLLSLGRRLQSALDWSHCGRAKHSLSGLSSCPPASMDRGPHELGGSCSSCLLETLLLRCSDWAAPGALCPAPAVLTGYLNQEKPRKLLLIGQLCAS